MLSTNKRLRPLKIKRCVSLSRRSSFHSNAQAVDRFVAVKPSLHRFIAELLKIEQTATTNSKTEESSSYQTRRTASLELSIKLASDRIRTR